jgi:DNA-directed RNA polymerase beta subunit
MYQSELQECQGFTESVGRSKSAIFRRDDVGVSCEFTTASPSQIFENQGVAESGGRSKSAIFGRDAVSYENNKFPRAPTASASATQAEYFTNSYELRSPEFPRIPSTSSPEYFTVSESAKTNNVIFRSGEKTMLRIPKKNLHSDTTKILKEIIAEEVAVHTQTQEKKEELIRDILTKNMNEVGMGHSLEDLRKKIENEIQRIQTDDGKHVLDHLGEYVDEPFVLLESYFEAQHLERLVRHQIESYNHFINFQIQRTIQMFNPVRIRSENDFVESEGMYMLEIVVSFDNFKLYPPQIHENNGATKLMLPQEAKLRNFTYSSGMTVDVHIQYIIRNTENMQQTRIIEKTLPKINIGKMPIMLKSSVCVLTQNKHIHSAFTGECPMDCGGYFIIKGSEKTVLGQERAAENRIYCFDGKNTTKWSWFAEIKSVPDSKCISPKQVDMMIASKNNGFGHGIFVTIPRIKQPVELFVLFRALGIISDKAICEFILLNIHDTKYAELLNSLQASIIDANKFPTQEDAIKQIITLVAFTPINMDRETGARKKREFALDVLSNDLFPHCKTPQQKIYLLGVMAKKLLETSLGWVSPDDRDSYLNKRIELTGTLLNNLFRNYFNKLIKEMQKQVVREINNGSWKSMEDYENIINMTNIYKIMKSTTIENGINRALSTGDFSIKQSNSSKVGVAQVLNRLTYVASLSHLRRINTPLEKSGELIAPRKLHNTTWGFLCPAETPEGQSIGVVKNISYMTHITIPTNSSSLYEYVAPFIQTVDSAGNPVELYDKVKVFINGCWVGVAETPMDLYLDMKNKKYRGIINIYTSIVFDYKTMEIRICNDGGRLARPVLRVRDNRALLTPEIIQKIASKQLSWNDLLTNCRIDESVIEYIDPEEQNYAMIAMKSKNRYLVDPRFRTNYTHSEIHPSTIFGVLASCIPFPEHNQAPRNTYQCLHPDTTVWMANLTQKPIKDVMVGESVLTFHPETLDITTTIVSGQFVQESHTDLYTITTKHGNSIIATEDHQFMTLNGWKQVSQMIDEVRANKTSEIGHLDKTHKMVFTQIESITLSPKSLVSCIETESENHSFIAGSGFASSNCAMSKQSIGIYSTNFDQRMDKTAYILSYPSRPLVDTRLMNFIQLNKIPSGQQIHVAIMTHTGYNQEDSVLVNKGSIDRGLFMSTIYHTEKDEDKNIIRDEIIRCKPNKQKTKGIKFGNYDKLNEQGFIPENAMVENRDVIIAKIIPIKENRNDPTKTIKYEDQSKTFRTTEETYIDKNYTGRNGDGYNFAKVRVRILRKPVLGDKFCALPTQQVLTDHGWVEIRYVDPAIHRVCSLDVNGKMCYEFPSAKFEYDHDSITGEDQPLCSFQNKQVEFVCTHNHKLYVERRRVKSLGYELIEAGTVMSEKKQVRFQKTMKNAYPDQATIRIGETDYDMDTWLQLVGMFISDGHCDKTNTRIFITAIKDRKREFLEIILASLDIAYTYSKDGKFYISGYKFTKIYEELTNMGQGALHKHLPEYVWNLSQRQSIVLMEALLQGDGHTMEYKGEAGFSRYGTISPGLADDITRLALHCGWSGIVKIAEEPTGIARTGKRNLGSRAGEDVSIALQHTYYKVSIIRSQNQPWIYKKDNASNVESRVDYCGKVYCIEMPSSHVYYMRESQTSPCLIIGNSSRHGQKGTCGNIIPECDMPFTKEGLRPDIIINPHAIPSRMTIAQLKETLLGKVLLELGIFGDGTSFGNLDIKTISEELQKLGYESYGNEIMYNGLTGEQLETSIFMGPVFYQRLKHMVNDKQHSRSIGPMVNLTRQPAEGRSRDGGFRIGEMERDVMIAHGMSSFCKERLYDVSDKYSTHVCKKCGMIAPFNDGDRTANSDFTIHRCNTCDNMTEFSRVNIPYSYKLLSQELQTINVVPRLITE